MLFAPGTSNKDIAAAEKALAKQKNRGRGRGAVITDTFIVRPPRTKQKPARKNLDGDQTAVAANTFPVPPQNVQQIAQPASLSKKARRSPSSGATRVTVAKGGMMKGYAKGGMANCGASMKPNGAARGK